MADYISQITLPDENTYDLRNKHLKVYSGTCNTAAGTEIKDVICTDAFQLEKGAVLFVTFTATNTAAVANLKLRVNNTTDSTLAKPIKHQYNAAESDLPGVGYIRANQTYQFYYDGTNWVMNTDFNSDTLTRQQIDTNRTGKYSLLQSYYTIGTATNTTARTTYRTDNLYVEPSTGTLFATIFNGSGASLTSLNASNISDGTLNLARLGNQNKNLVLAGPATGNAAVPTFRALVAADIPNLSWNKITSNKPTTLSGYGITDAKIASGVITLGSNTITPITSIAELTGGTITAANLRTNLGLSSALRFIGKATTDISESTTTAPTVTGVTNYAPAIGDVVLDKNSDAEYVCIAKTTTNNTTTYTWELLGRSGSWATSSHTHGNITNGGLLGAANMAVVTDGSKKITTADLSVSDSNASTNATTTFVQAVTQNAQGKITVTKASLNTSGTWSGNAATATTATWATLIKPIASTTTASASTWSIPSGSYQVWGERFSDTRLKYTPSGGSESTVTDTGDWTMWLTGNGTSNTATLNMRIDGTYYGSFSGNLSGTASNADTVDNLHASDFVRAYGTTNDNIDSDWGQSFKTFDPIPSGTPPAKNPNISTINIGNNFNRRKQFALIYNTDDIYYRRRVDGSWKSWVRLLHSGNYNDYAPTKTGGGASGTWGISVTGSSASCTGNATTATALTSSAGDTYTPVYFTGGKPSVAYPVEYFTWTIGSGKTGVTLTGANIFAANTYSVTLVVTSGEANLNGPITWTSAANTFTIQSSAATSGTVSGYALVARGTDITSSLTSAQIG